MATAPDSYPKTTPLPTFAGWLVWVRTVMGVPNQYMPVDPTYVDLAYQFAVSIVNPVLSGVPGVIYQQAVYNLAGHYLALYAQDNPVVFITQDGVDYGYFEWLRKSNNMLGFVTGIVNSTSDESTSVSMTVPHSLENLTISQLGLTSTIWGRTYLGFAQSWSGPWGIS